MLEEQENYTIGNRGCIMQELSDNSVKLIYDPDTMKFQTQDYLRIKSIRKAKNKYRE